MSQKNDSLLVIAAGILAFDEATKQTQAHCRMDRFTQEFANYIAEAFRNPNEIVARAEKLGNVKINLGGESDDNVVKNSNWVVRT